MYDFHYSCIKRKYPDLTALFIDTDPLKYQIQTDNVYEDFYADKQLFDFSRYRKEIPFYNDANKKINGKMKDELNREFIEEFVGLRAKMYSLKTRNEETKKAKGVKKNVVKKDISLQDYVDCLFEERKFMHTMQTIRSFKHQLYTIKQNKVSLSPCDDKQYLLDDGVSSLPYGCFSWLLIFRKCVDYFFRNFCNIFYFWRNLNRIKKSF